MKHYYLFIIAVVFAVFLNTEILPSMGYDTMLVTIAFMPMMAYIGLGILYKKITISTRYSKDAVHLLIMAALIIALKYGAGQNYFKKMIEFLIIPAIVSVCFDFLTAKEYSVIRKTMIIFFVCECGLSLLEKMTGNNYFFNNADMEYFKELGMHRASSFLGHPLANSMFVAVFMAFVAISDFKKIYFQVFLVLFGYIALFCFGGRGATLVVTIFLVPYFYLKLNKIIRKRKWILNLGVICVVFGMLYLFSETELGARFQKTDQGEGSTKTRFEVLQFYKFYNNDEQFYWGHPDNYQYMMRKLGAAGVENGVITLILDYGIILTIPLLILLFKFHWHKLSVFPARGKWLVILVFYLVGNMNPNLAKPLMWVLWIFSYYAFKPELSSGKNKT